VAAVQTLPGRSFLIDGEAIVTNEPSVNFIGARAYELVTDESKI
jgi:hypothetical protein